MLTGFLLRKVGVGEDRSSIRVTNFYEHQPQPGARLVPWNTEVLEHLILVGETDAQGSGSGTS